MCGCAAPGAPAESAASVPISAEISSWLLAAASEDGAWVWVVKIVTVTVFSPRFYPDESSFPSSEKLG
jgi:hypothetical protein